MIVILFTVNSQIETLGWEYLPRRTEVTALLPKQLRKFFHPDIWQTSLPFLSPRHKEWAVSTFGIIDFIFAYPISPVSFGHR